VRALLADWHSHCLSPGTSEGYAMARKTRFSSPDLAFHVVNRGNDRRTVFRQDFDYMVFMELLREGKRKSAIRIYGYCAMPNHFHLLLQPETKEALSAYMQWVTCRYACDLRRQTETVGHGHVFQRRFWNAAVHDDEMFLGILRYIEANPRSGHLVDNAEDWKWSSLADRRGLDREILSPLPIELPPRWLACVNSPQAAEQVAEIREAIAPKRGRPPVKKSE
jgi:putative transposase